MSGATGLDYGVLQGVMRLHSIPRREWPETFSAIQIMEDEALKAMHEKRK